VPVSQIPRFIDIAGGWVAQHVPQGVLVAYGHLGDGNLHFNINQRAGTQAAQLQAVEPRLRRAIHDLVRDFGGSFSAEHGIGQLKVFELERYANPLELELMRRVKKAFDPNGILRCSSSDHCTAASTSCTGVPSGARSARVLWVPRYGVVMDTGL
jgi:D-lactate dehydrogenase (cytochrome)